MPRARDTEWFALETRAADIYRTLGYDVSRDVILSGQQVDLLCERRAPGAGTFRLMVECKYLGRARAAVSNQDVQDFVSTFHALRVPNGLSQGVMITNARYSAVAKSVVVQHPDVSRLLPVRVRRVPSRAIGVATRGLCANARP